MRNEGSDRVHEEFVKPGPLPPGANLADAEARLLETLERELGLSIEPPGRPKLRRVRPNRLRPLLAIAAVLLAAAGLTWSLGALKHEPPVLRGPGTVDPGAWVARARATPLPGGRMRLEWAEAPGATAYAVVFLGADLNEIARVGDVAATSLVLDPAHLPEGLASNSAVLWRVAAYSGRDQIARSATAPLALP